ncbi:MAG: PTS transporter subunit EIIC [Brevinema sp.]
MFKYFQKIGKSLMLPIAVLPAAGLLLGIGGALSNPNTIQAYPFLDITWIQSILQVMAASGEIIFVNLALLICIGITIGLSHSDKGTAALSAVVGFLVMNAAIKSLLHISRTEGSIDTGVVGALAMGFVISYLHNKYHDIQLPEVLGFFGGSRFIPIISSFSGILIGFLFFLIWPEFQKGLITAGNSIASLGSFGTFLYGFLLRLTGAIGLHHMIYPLFWLTELGGVEQVAGQTIVGAQNIFFAQLANPTHTGLFTEGTRFFAGRFVTMMFGLPGACLAMYLSVPIEKRKLVGGLFLSAAITSFITGITEPIEFMFLFVAPYLYVLHAFLDGLSFWIADLLNISIGNTFSGGFIDFTLFGILQGNESTNWIYVPIIGVCWFFLYFFSFKFLISLFNIPTPGREEDGEDIHILSKDSLQQTAVTILNALGGKDNIEDIDACITRLRIAVKDIHKVDQVALKKTGASAVLEMQGGIQAIFGAMADPLKQRINKLLEREDQ